MCAVIQNLSKRIKPKPIISLQNNDSKYLILKPKRNGKSIEIKSKE